MKRRFTMHAAILAMGAILAVGPGATRADDWPCLLGPTHNGVSAETGLTAGWPRGGGPATPLPRGVGHG